MFDDEKFSKAFMESDFAEISRLMSEKEGGVTVENGDEPSITFFGQKVVYSPENGSYGGTG